MKTKTKNVGGSNMQRKTFNWHGKKYYLLGEKDGEKLYLEEAHFDCDWYWGLGYIETFTNKARPERSADISSHTHFDILFRKYSDFVDDLETPFTEHERYQIFEIMRSLYTARQYSDMIYTGGAHVTTNPAKDTIKNEAEYDRINKVVIPAMLEELYKILEGRAA